MPGCVTAGRVFKFPVPVSALRNRPFIAMKTGTVRKSWKEPVERLILSQL